MMLKQGVNNIFTIFIGGMHGVIRNYRVMRLNFWRNCVHFHIFMRNKVMNKYSIDFLASWRN